MSEFPDGIRRQRVRRQSLEVTVEDYKRLVSQVGQSLEPDEDWEPTLLVETKDDERVALQLSAFFVDGRGRQHSLVAIPLLIRELDGWLAAMVVNAWTVNSDEDDGSLPPAEHPRRREVVLITVVDEQGDIQGHMADVVRREGRPPVLRNWESSGDCGGPLTDALRAGFEEAPAA